MALYFNTMVLLGSHSKYHLLRLITQSAWSCQPCLSTAFFSEKIFYHVLLMQYWSYEVEICMACCQCISIAYCDSVFSLHNQHLNGSQITKKVLILFTLQFSGIDSPKATAPMKLKFSQLFTHMVLQQ